MLRSILFAALLAAPAAAQIEPPDAYPARDPRVTRVVTATRIDLPNGVIRHVFTLGADIKASDRDKAWCDSWESGDCEPVLTGDVVYVEGVSGFPPGSTYGDYYGRTHCNWMSTYDWECAENWTAQPQPAIDVSSGLIPEINLLHPINWNKGGHGYPLYFVGYGFGTQTVPAAQPRDGLIDWSGPGGGWVGQSNNINPSADDQEMSGDLWTARRLVAAWGNAGVEVPIYFTPTHQANWWNEEWQSECNWTLPSPGCIGCEPKPEGDECTGHAWLRMKSSRMDCRAAMQFAIDWVPANLLPLEVEPDPRELFIAALVATVNERERWPWIFEHRGRILSVDRDEHGKAVIGYRPD